MIDLDISERPAGCEEMPLRREYLFDVTDITPFGRSIAQLMAEYCSMGDDPFFKYHTGSSATPEVLRKVQTFVIIL